ncbi:MAG: hypothetical protein ACFE9Z_00565 [Promethearchaeota archaeon]
MISGFIKKKRDKKKNNTANKDTPESQSVVFKKDTILDDNEKKIVSVKKNGKVVAKFEEIQEKSKNSKIQTIVIEKEQGVDFSILDLMDDETMIIPLNIKDKIERIILKILYEEKFVKSLKILTEKVLEKTNEEKITISEKNINKIIYELNKDEKILFTQTEGWKIRI